MVCDPGMGLCDFFMLPKNIAHLYKHALLHEHNVQTSSYRGRPPLRCRGHACHAWAVSKK